MTNPLEENMKSAIINKYNDQETLAFLFDKGMDLN